MPITTVQDLLNTLAKYPADTKIFHELDGTLQTLMVELVNARPVPNGLDYEILILNDPSQEKVIALTRAF